MKKGSLIMALFLCLIAVGGLAVLFRADNSTPSDNNSSGGNGGNSGYESEVEGIGLNETRLIF